MDKRTVRRKCFARIKSLSSEEKTRFSEAIAQSIEATVAFREAHCIFTFYAMPGEPDLAELFRKNPGKTWGFSRVGKDDRITFHRVESFEAFIEGDYGFLEPDPDICPALPPSDPDLILIPGVGFDPVNLARIGRGKGHYDRFLEAALTRSPRPALFGVCFETQLTSLSPEPHDVPMTAVFTESGRAS